MKEKFKQDELFTVFRTIYGILSDDFNTYTFYTPPYLCKVSIFHRTSCLKSILAVKIIKLKKKDFNIFVSL